MSDVHILAIAPATEQWTLHAEKQARTHVESEIRNACADLDCETIRRGSPHSLVCPKNDAPGRATKAGSSRTLHVPG